MVPRFFIFLATFFLRSDSCEMGEHNRSPAQLTSNLTQSKDEKDLSREAVYVLCLVEEEDES